MISEDEGLKASVRVVSPIFFWWGSRLMEVAEVQRREPLDDMGNDDWGVRATSRKRNMKRQIRAYLGVFDFFFEDQDDS